MKGVVLSSFHVKTKNINEESSKQYKDKHLLFNIPDSTHAIDQQKSRPSKPIPLYDEPYIVAGKNQGGSLGLKDEQNEFIRKNYTHSQLKMVNTYESHLENDLYEVEDIRVHHRSSGIRDFFVKWLVTAIVLRHGKRLLISQTLYMYKVIGIELILVLKSKEREEPLLNLPLRVCRRIPHRGM